MKQSRLVLMATVFMVASCQKSPPVPPESPGAAPAATVAPSEPAVAGARKSVIKPGKYRICQDAGESGHGPVVGAHLQVDQTLEIKPFGANGATKVCFKKECPPAGSNPPESEVKVMWLAGDENKLSGESSFDHNKNGQTEKLSHFVQIFDDPDDHGDAELCTKPNVLTINFCTPDESSDELNCVGGTGPHLGHVHGEN
jgi:hypothetical protein